MQRRQDRRKRATQEVDPPSALKHPDRHQHCDQKRNDLQNNAKAFFRAFDKLFVNLHAARRGVEWEETEEKRNRQDRQGIHAANKNILRSRVGRYCETKQVWRRHADKKRDEEKS